MTSVTASGRYCNRCCHRTRVGCPWRNMSQCYGPWWRVYHLFATWQILGIWARIKSALLVAADAAGKLSWQVSVDSTTCRAHVHAAGGRRDNIDRVAGEPDHHALGRSHGGFSTKTHPACDHHRAVLAFHLSPGQAGDSPEMTTVLEAIHVARPGPGRARTRPDRVPGDKTYSSRANRHRRNRGSHNGRPPTFDTGIYQDRHTVEYGINIGKHHRGFATRYDKLAVRFEASTHIAIIDH